MKCHLYVPGRFDKAKSGWNVWKPTAKDETTQPKNLIFIWLVVEPSLCNILVSWDDYSQYMENKK